ncbi:MAG: TetR/AcrR family transcriptional regulator [Spirochaetales bacterium]|nr:TetR/AcrR family transcriptional regulator [Spirochaetales bacterium]
MPRGFTEQEKKNIHNRLLQCGKETFGRFGIKKTSVEDLTKQAGISKGAFYQFFQSKEDLYFAIIRNYETAQQERMYRLLSEESSNDKELLKMVLLEILDQVDNDPFLRRLLAKEEFEYLWQKFTPQQLEEAMTADIDFSSQLVQTWKKKGKLKIDDPRLIAGVFRAIFFLFLHKEDIGRESFSAVVDLLLDSSIDRLIKE